MMAKIDISIHAPHVGSDNTLGAKGMALADFNPRSPCGERRRRRQGCKTFSHFNPRSPCGERQLYQYVKEGLLVFQSTLPMRGATEVNLFGKHADRISIHAPHAGSDVL